MLYIVGKLGMGECGGGELIAPRRPADAQIYASGIQRLQETKVLRHLERAVMGKHHSAAANPYSASAGGYLSDQHIRAGAGEIGQVVVLCQPVALVSQGFRRHSQLNSLPKGLRCGAAFPHR